VLRGIYSAASGMIANQNRSEALTNNLANLNSPGYKADETMFRSFPEYMLSAVQVPNPGLDSGAPLTSGPVGYLSNGVYAHEMIPNFSQGDLQETDQPLDLAISDDQLAPAQAGDDVPLTGMLIQVEKNGQKGFVRNSSTKVDANRNLVTDDGSFVLDKQGGHITLPTDQYKIDGKGVVTYTDANGNPQTINIGKYAKPHLFFAIEKNGQAAYTRNGSFTLDANRNLVTTDGSFVLDDQGNHITLPSDHFTVDANGTLTDENNRKIKLQLVQVDNPYNLVKGENDGFLWQGPGQPPKAGAVAGSYQVRQGYVERSNVDEQQTMVDLMATLRSFEANQKVLSAYGQTLDKLFDASRVSS
jgi:flagellar basal body rod protein FlgG